MVLVCTGGLVGLHDAGAGPDPDARALRGLPLHGHQLPARHPAIRQDSPRQGHLPI